MRFTCRAFAAGAGSAALAWMLGFAQASPIRVLAESIPGAVPPEFAADLLIRIADSTAAATEPSDWRADLYEAAFQLARGAPDALPRYVRRDPRARSRVNPVGPGDRLDALSLQVRAFNGLFDLRRDRAIELAGAIETRVPALTCDDALVPSPGGRFDIARHSYELLERQVLAVRSSTELAPAFEAILAAEISPTESTTLLTALASAMRSLDDDDVSFSDTLRPTWAAVKHAMDSSDRPFAEFLLDAFRPYVVRHLTGPRCMGHTGIATPAPTEIETLSEVDETLRKHERPPLSARERTASRRIPISAETRTGDGVFFTTGLWQAPISKSLLAQAMALRTHIQSGRPVDDRRPPEWNEQLSQFYARMAAWTRRDEASLENYQRERLILLETLVDVIPSGADRLRALGDLLAFLKTDGRQLFGPGIWINHLHSLINTCRNSPVEWDWLLHALLDSGDPVMRLYAQVEQLPS